MAVFDGDEIHSNYSTLLCGGLHIVFSSGGNCRIASFPVSTEFAGSASTETLNTLIESVYLRMGTVRIDFPLYIS